MKTFIRKIALFALCSAAFLSLLGYAIESGFSTFNVEKVLWQKNKLNQHYDYAFLGSSRTYNMIDIQMIDSTRSSSGINLGLGGADFRTLYMVLYLFVDIQGNRINNLYLQVDPIFMYRSPRFNSLDHDHYFFSDSEHEEIKTVLKKPALWVYNYFPIVKHIEYNIVYNPAKLVKYLFFPNNWEQTKGSRLLDPDIPFTHNETYTGSAITAIHEKKEFYLTKILDLAADRNIKTTLYTAPVYQYLENFASQFPAFFKDIGEIADKRHLDYHNFSSLYPEKRTYYRDFIHLNKTGTQAFTRLFVNSTDIGQSTLIAE